MKKYSVLLGIYAALIGLVNIADAYLGPNISDAHERAPTAQEARSPTPRMPRKITVRLCTDALARETCPTPAHAEAVRDEVVMRNAVRLILLEALSTQR